MFGKIVKRTLTRQKIYFLANNLSPLKWTVIVVVTLWEGTDPRLFKKVGDLAAHHKLMQ